MLMALFIRRVIGSKGKRLSIEHNFIVILRSHLKDKASLALMIVSRDIAC